MKTHRHVQTVALVVLAVAALTAVQADRPEPTIAAKKALSAEDYTRWRSINSPEMSGDGQWVAYVLQLTNTPAAQAKPELHILNLQTNQEVVVANATGHAVLRRFEVDCVSGRSRRRTPGARERGR